MTTFRQHFYLWNTNVLVMLTYSLATFMPHQLAIQSTELAVLIFLCHQNRLSVYCIICCQSCANNIPKTFCLSWPWCSKYRDLSPTSTCLRWHNSNILIDCCETPGNKYVQCIVARSWGIALFCLFLTFCYCCLFFGGFFLVLSGFCVFCLVFIFVVLFFVCLLVCLCVCFWWHNIPLYSF